MGIFFSPPQFWVLNAQVPRFKHKYIWKKMTKNYSYQISHFLAVAGSEDEK